MIPSACISFLATLKWPTGVNFYRLATCPGCTPPLVESQLGSARAFPVTSNGKIGIENFHLHNFVCVMVLIHLLLFNINNIFHDLDQMTCAYKTLVTVKIHE